jgi:hypothetical protein
MWSIAFRKFSMIAVFGSGQNTEWDFCDWSGDREVAGDLLTIKKANAFDAVCDSAFLSQKV